MTSFIIRSENVSQKSVKSTSVRWFYRRHRSQCLRNFCSFDLNSDFGRRGLVSQLDFELAKKNL